MPFYNSSHPRLVNLCTHLRT